MKTTLATIALVLFAALSPTAGAQITINALPVVEGFGEYVQYDTQNEDGSNTAAIQALIAASGANQTYDLTAITYETTFTGQFAVVAGAVGPGAATEPLGQATTTFALPFEQVEEGNEFEGVIYDYIQETSDASYNLGGYFEGTLNGEDAQFTTTRTPQGDKEFVFPMTMGMTWTSSFTQTTALGASTFDAELSKTYEVDGWGQMLLPGVEGPIDVLRVKVTTTQEFAGIPFSDVCYDLRPNTMAGAYFCEGSFGEPPTAYATFFGPASTDSESGAEASALALDAIYPNPTRDVAVLHYELPSSGAATLKIYDVLGREVLSVVDGVQPAGVHDRPVDVRALAPGMYVARLEAHGVLQSRSFTVVR